MKKESVSVRIVLIIFIIILLLIPLLMIQDLIKERQDYKDEALNDIYKSWANKQLVAGPVLTIEQIKEEISGERKYLTKTNKHFLPEKLNITTELIPEKRYRGIYEVVVYRAKIKMKGFFTDSIFENLELNNRNTSEYISFNIDDLRGIEKSTFKWNGTTPELNPGLKNDEVFKNGLHAVVDIKKEEKVYNFELELNVKGSEEILFLPLGKFTEVDLKSTWNNPSFTGIFLPSSRNIDENGFTAKWNINYFNRDFPQRWENKIYKLNDSMFGTKLLMPVNEYQKTMRTSKYGIMIIILTFISFFMIEVFSKKIIHPIQYLLVGLSLVLFYSILLSLSEYILFKYSYLISAILMITLIFFYVKSIYRNFKLGLVLGTLLFFFYGFMYIILQLQDYSLLLGNIALFILLALIMILTRGVNWYEIFNPKSETVK